MNTDHATPELFAALSKAQGEIENANKNAANPHFKSKYADLAEVLNTIRPPFSANGLSLIQSTEFDGALVSVTTLLAHSSGGFVTATASCVPAKTDAQGVGSSTTYLRRYSAASVAGIAQEDDDGQSAAHGGKPAPLTRKVTPVDGVWESLDTETQAGLELLAISVREFLEAGDAAGAVTRIERDKLNADEKTGFWTLLGSSERSALKRAADAAKKAA